MDTGRFTSSTSEYPEWFLTAFAVAEPEIFALASTQAPPGTASLEALPTNFNNNEMILARKIYHDLGRGARIQVKAVSRA